MPKKLEVEAASGKCFIFHKFSVRNSGASSGDDRKLRVQLARWGYDIYRPSTLNALGVLMGGWKRRETGNTRNVGQRFITLES